MIIFHRYEEKNKEEALEKCLDELNTSIDHLYIKESEEEGKLFRSKKYIIEAVKKEDVINYIKEYIKELSSKMNISITCEVREINNTINVILVSDKSAIIIGKDGKNLNSLQILIRQTVNNMCPFSIKIMVDASNYKSKKQKNLEFEIKRICKEVLRTKVEVKLDPMNSYERRLVHTIVGDFPNLVSESIGESPNRYTIIKYKD